MLSPLQSMQENQASKAEELAFLQKWAAGSPKKHAAFKEQAVYLLAKYKAVQEYAASQLEVFDGLPLEKGKFGNQEIPHMLQQSLGGPTGFKVVAVCWNFQDAKQDWTTCMHV